jgi:hypothetical protein
MATMMPMIATTIRSSISEKPPCVFVGFMMSTVPRVAARVRSAAGGS